MLFTSPFLPPPRANIQLWCIMSRRKTTLSVDSGEADKSVKLVACILFPQAAVCVLSSSFRLIKCCCHLQKPQLQLGPSEEPGSPGRLLLMLCTPVETSEMHLGRLPRCRTWNFLGAIWRHELRRMKKHRKRDALD